MERRNLSIIEGALNRFKALVDSLECACDPAYDYECPLHRDRRLARHALDALTAEKAGDHAPPAPHSGYAEVWLILRKRAGALVGARAVAITSADEHADMLAANAEAMNGEDGEITQNSILLTERRNTQRVADLVKRINAVVDDYFVVAGGGAP